MAVVVIACLLIGFFIGHISTVRSRSSELDLCRSVVSIQADEINEKNRMITQGPWRAM